MSSQRFLTQTEIRDLLAAVPDVTSSVMSVRQEAMMVKTALYLGLRNKETVSMQRSQVDMEKHRVFIPAEKTKDTRGDDGDGAPAGQRYVPIPEQIGPMDERFRTEFYDYIEWVMDLDGNFDDWLFPSPRSHGHVSKRHFRTVMKHASIEADLYQQNVTRDTYDELPKKRKVTPHTLRHTYGNWARENAIPDKMSWVELAELMGHADVSMTKNRYQNPRQDELDKSAQHIFS